MSALPKRSGSMLCNPFSEKRLDSWGFPVFVQPKLDGDRIRARKGFDPILPQFCSNMDTILLSSYLKPRNFAVPHIIDAYNNLCHDNEQCIPLDGEGYIHGWDHEEIHGLFSRTENIHPHYQKGELHVFDLAYTHLRQWERFKILNGLNLQWPFVTVPTYLVENYDQLWYYYDMFIEQEYEGIIVRHPDAGYINRRSIYVMKFKPRKDDWYAIVDVKEAVDRDTGEGLGRLGSLVCCGDDGTRFDVGTGVGITIADCVRLWSIRETLPGQWCHVKYQHLSSKGRVPIFAKFVTIEKRSEEHGDIDPFNLIGG